jgi:regulator of protease activity HflC (stomatin/prohibitin superfamily)
MLPPGLSFAGFDVCGCCISFRSITSRVDQWVVDVKTKTKDNVFVVVKVAVQQFVKEDCVQDAMYKLSNVHEQSNSYVSEVVRSYVPHMTLDEAFGKQDDISSAVSQKLTVEMDGYGFKIHRALVTELIPNAEVVLAMNEIKQAEAAADAAELQGRGIARKRGAIIDGLRDSITHGTDEKLGTAKLSELLLTTQYFETLRDIGANSKSQTVFLPHSAGAVSDVASQVRDGFLQAGAPNQQSM